MGCCRVAYIYGAVEDADDLQRLFVDMERVILYALKARLDPGVGLVSYLFYVLHIADSPKSVIQNLSDLYAYDIIILSGGQTGD